MPTCSATVCLSFDLLSGKLDVLFTPILGIVYRNVGFHTLFIFVLRAHV